MIKYIVDEEHRKVTALMDYNAEVLVKKANNIFGDRLSDKVKEKLMLRSEYKATAYCRLGDTFDPEIGKKLAKRYMFEKLEYDRNRVCKRFVEDILGIYDGVNRFLSRKICSEAYFRYLLDLDNRIVNEIRSNDGCISYNLDDWDDWDDWDYK